MTIVQGLLKHRGRRVAVVLLLGLVVIAGPASRRAIPTAHAGTEAGTSIRLATSEAAALPPAETLRGASYGSFDWYEVTAAGLRALDAAGTPYERVADGSLLFTNIARFDPLVNPPSLPPDLTGQGAPSGPSFWLVQLVGPTRGEWLDQMAMLGATPVQYLAQHAYITWATEDVASQLAAAPFVRWVGPFQPAYRLAPELWATSGRQEVTVLTYEAGFDAYAAELASLGGAIITADPAGNDGTRVTIVEIDGRALRLLAGQRAVMAITGHGRHPATTDEMSDKISAGMVVAAGNAPQPKPPGFRDGFLDPLGVHGAGVVVHINDDGVGQSHQDLAGRMVAEWGGQNSPHATHVAGIVLGAGFANIGDTLSSGGWVYGLGMAPFASYIDDYFNCAPSTCGQHAIGGGAVVSNNSWGYTNGQGQFNAGYGYTTNARTWDGLVKDAHSGQSGAQPLAIFGAAGNSGSGGETIGEPWEAKNTMSVAASLNWRNSFGQSGGGDINAIAGYSSRGNCKDGRICPWIAAPGSNIISSRLGTTSCGSQPAPSSSQHSVCSGTSMATPHVTGSAADLTEWWRNGHFGVTPSPAMLKAVMVNGATDMGGADIPNTFEGWGRVNIGTHIIPTAPSLYWDQSTVFHNSGENWSATFAPADTSKPFKVTLLWSDAQGSGGGGSSAAWVNDLDLQVTKLGTTWRGNNFAFGWSFPGGSFDFKNNVENVFIQNPTAGGYNIQVNAANLAGDGVWFNGDPTDQDYALVCYNCVLVEGTPTATPTPLETSVPTPTEAGGAGLPTATWTPGGPTMTSTPTSPAATNTSSPSTATSTPLATATDTPPPSKMTSTPLPPTSTNTPLPPTSTSTPLPPTATNTPLPPTATDTPLPPTATNTPLPVTATDVSSQPTATNTPAAATATPTLPPKPRFLSSACASCRPGDGRGVDARHDRFGWRSLPAAELPASGPFAKNTVGFE